MVIIATAGVLKENNRNTLVKGEGSPIYVFKGQKP
jgi:hypothetical protein